MDTQILNERISKFLEDYPEIQKEGREAEKLRKQFVKDYPLKHIPNLTLREYSIGHGTNDSFCYRIERELVVLGRIGGHFNGSIQYGIYYSQNNNCYVKSVNKFGDDDDEALTLILQEIVDLINAANNIDFQEISKNKLPPLYKGKLLSVYYPNRFLNVYSEAHINHFNGLFGTDYGNYKALTLEERKDRLVDYKNANNIMRSWTLWEYMIFLYRVIGRPGDNENKGTPTDEVGGELPSIDTIEIQEFNGKVKTPPKKETKNKTNNKSGKKPRKLNYEKQNRENKLLGARGEQIVMIHEESRLTEEGNADLIKKLKQVSEKDDSLGYDIMSWDSSKTKRYIEVKSTKSAPGTANFIITSNEIEKAERLSNYYIYVVFKAHTKNPSIWKLKKPFDDPDKLDKEPINYRIKIYSK